MTQLPITIHVNLKEEDLADFYYHNARRSILMKMVIAFALIVFIAQSIRVILVPAAFEQGIIWMIAVIVLFFLMYYSNKSNAKKEFKRNKKLHEPHMYIVNEDSIHIMGGPFNTIFQWDKLFDMTESKNSFFIWLSKNSAQLIPKRDLSPQEVIVIQEIKNTKLNK